MKQFDKKVILDHSEYIDKMMSEILNPKKESAKNELLMQKNKQ